MLGQFFTDHIIWALLFWALIYISDYYLTIYSVKGQDKYIREHIAIEGSPELTPVFQKDVDQRRWFSWRFGLMLLGSTGYIFCCWLLFVGFFNLRPIFQGIYGAFVFLEVIVHRRHLSNLSMIRSTRGGVGLEGKVTYSRWLIYRNSSNDFFTGGLIFLLIFLFTGDWFLLGGAVLTLLNAVGHLRMSNRFLKASRQPASAPAGPSAEAAK